MAYKAVFINEDHIAHAGSTYQYVPTHNGMGNPHHGVGGMFTTNPMGRDEHSSTYTTHDYGSAKNPKGKDYWKNYNSESSSSSNGSNTGPVNYTRGDPYSMTNEELRDRNTRATLINNYNRNYPSAEQQFQENAQKVNQLVNNGAQFAKTFVQEPNYTRLDLSNISNEELARANERARLENQYNQYYNPPKEDHTKEWIDRAAQGIGLAVSAAGVVVPIILAAKSKKSN